MKIKTSITISQELVKTIDRNLDDSHSRSSFIESAVKYYLQKLGKAVRDDQDLIILNAAAGELNREADDVLRYQD